MVWSFCLSTNLNSLFLHFLSMYAFISNVSIECNLYPSKWDKTWLIAINTACNKHMYEKLTDLFFQITKPKCKLHLYSFFFLEFSYMTKCGIFSLLANLDSVKLFVFLHAYFSTINIKCNLFPSKCAQINFNYSK